MYAKSEEQVAFFAAHDERGAKVTPIDEILLDRYHTPKDQQPITRVVRLSYEFELLLYKTVIAIPPAEE
jgi:pyrroloquinoline-quinone synthase